MALNKIFLIGNMVADPELKQTANGIPVTSFRVAVNRKFTRQGEQPQTDFFDVVCWRQQAEFVCKYFPKGKQILIIGSMQS
ncbi:MAG: single-stranded DNA-binding protein, partial [Clostridia bacterium]|nr:single-stranded DNA-binding protein [Clostridia bacterium]